MIFYRKAVDLGTMDHILIYFYVFCLKFDFSIENLLTDFDQ